MALAFPRVAAAQDGLAVTAYGGATFPVGDFGDEIGEEAGLATPGVVVGAEVGVPLRAVPGLLWQSTLEGMTFGVDKDLFVALLGDQGSLEVGHYWVAVVHTGARYSMPVNPLLRLHGTAQVSLGLFKAPGATVSAFGETAKFSTDWASARGYALGAGVTFSDRVDLHAAYKRLINPELSGKLRYSGGVEPIEGDQEVSWLQVTLGLRIR